MPSRHAELQAKRLRRAADVVLVTSLAVLGWTYGFVYVEGASMEPTLTPGDIAVYRRDVPEVVRGELVVFEHDGTLVLHRVAGVLNDGSIRTRGDANESLDAVPVVDHKVRGRVVLVLPTGRGAQRLAALLH
ncbi:MAG: signal peptidase I [Coriobacteriia bacterium]